MKHNKRFLISLIALSMSGLSYAADTDAPKNDDELQDMSDPLAVFTQVGFGITDKGLNLKLGQTYDTGNDNTAAMNIVELKGFAGDITGWRGSNERDDSIDSFRWRNFGVKLDTYTGSQLDVNYSIDGNKLVADGDTADISYSIIQALPPVGPVSFFPLLGAGVSVGENAYDSDDMAMHNKDNVESGYSFMGAFAVAGMYAKVQITDKIWLNYNPMWFTTLSGSDNYKDNYYGVDESSVLAHEFVASYQFTPRFNMRYFANWSSHSSFGEGNHRLEFNYQI